MARKQENFSKSVDDAKFDAKEIAGKGMHAAQNLASDVTDSAKDVVEDITHGESPNARLSDIYDAAQPVISEFIDEAQDYFSKARKFARENPAQAAGLAVLGGAALWALIGTKPGRGLLKTGSALAAPYATQWVMNRTGLLA